MRWGAPSRRSFCLFWRETKQRPEPAIFDVTGSEKGNEREELAKGAAEGQSGVDNGQQKRPVGMR